MPIMIQINAADEYELSRLLLAITAGLPKVPTDAELDARSKEWAIAVNETPTVEPAEPVRELTMTEKRQLNMKKAQEVLRQRRKQAAKEAHEAGAKRAKAAEEAAVAKRPRGRPRKEVQLAHAKMPEPDVIDPNFDVQQDAPDVEAGEDDNTVLDNVMEDDTEALQEKLFEEAQDQMRRMFADPVTSPHIRSLMHRMGVVKFGDLDPSRGDELLREVRKIQAVTRGAR